MTALLPRPDEGASTPTDTRRYLMCPPTYFAVDYCINPWMYPDDPVDVDRAVQQWQVVADTLRDFGHEVVEMAAAPDLPDLVFAANGGIVIGDRAMTPRFHHHERQRESALFAAALRRLGITAVAEPTVANEGEGDFLFTGERVLGGTGFRSDPAAADEVSAFFGVPVVALRLRDPRFYHLDTALTVLDRTTVAYWPGAFDDDSRALLERLYPDAVIATETDAAGFGLNTVSDGRHVLISQDAPTLAAAIEDRGFDVHRVDVSELRKAGGGAKCCVLTLHPAPRRSADEPAGTVDA